VAASAPDGPARGPSAALAGRRVAVLGSTGFLGRHLSAGLAARGAEVLPISRSAGVRLDLLAAPPGEVARLLDAFGVQVVVNAAGVVWPTDAATPRAGNAELATRLVRALATLLPRPRLIHLGSIHEYGPGAPGTGIREDQPPSPVTPYGRDKLAATRAVLAAPPGLDTVVLRLANVAGPQAPPGSIFGRVAAHLAAAATQPRPTPLSLPRLRTHRDVIDVRDVLTAVCAAATAPAARISGQVINIGSGQAVPMRDLVTRMITLSGVPVPLQESPTPPPRVPHVTWQHLDLTRARTLLNWHPHYPLDATLTSVLTPTTAHVRRTRG